MIKHISISASLTHHRVPASEGLTNTKNTIQHVSPRSIEMSLTKHNKPSPVIRKFTQGKICHWKESLFVDKCTRLGFYSFASSTKLVFFWATLRKLSSFSVWLAGPVKMHSSRNFDQFRFVVQLVRSKANSKISTVRSNIRLLSGNCTQGSKGKQLYFFCLKGT